MSGYILDMLIEREGALRARIDELRAQLIPAEAELEDIAVAKAALMDAASRRIAQLPATGSEASAASLAYFNGKANNTPFQSLTMKQLVRKALTEKFQGGATARQLLDLFHHEYGRTDIIRSSLSPQLSRLKVEREIWRDGLVWRLAEQKADTGNLIQRIEDFGAEAPDENEPPSDQKEGGSDTALAAR